MLDYFKHRLQPRINVARRGLDEAAAVSHPGVRLKSDFLDRGIVAAKTIYLLFDHREMIGMNFDLDLASIQKLVVMMKDELEKIKEQTNNIL